MNFWSFSISWFEPIGWSDESLAVLRASKCCRGRLLKAIRARTVYFFPDGSQMYIIWYWTRDADFSTSSSYLAVFGLFVVLVFMVQHFEFRCAKFLRLIRFFRAHLKLFAHPPLFLPSPLFPLRFSNCFVSIVRGIIDLIDNSLNY